MKYMKLIAAFGFTLVLATKALAQQECNANKPMATPSTEFTESEMGTIIHKRTGLVWKRCAEGQTWNAGSCMGTPLKLSWARAQKAAERTNTGNIGGWRLPNIGELQTIVEENCAAPSINQTIFPETSSAHFWSSSTSANNPKFAWYVYFKNGFSQSHDKKEFHQVRLVRTGI